jgi:hypothetical protein
MTIKNEEDTPRADSNGDAPAPAAAEEQNKASGTEGDIEDYIEAAATQAAATNEESNSDNGDDGDDEGNSWRAKKIKHWKDNHFAVGCVNANWKDDRMWCGTGRNHADINHAVWPSAYVCGCLGADRVGNLAILAQTTEECNEVEMVNGNLRRRRRRPKLLWVVGPYWPVNLCLTYPLILGISFWTAYTKLVDQHIAVIITWGFCTGFLIFALLMVACGDPGVLYRQKQIPAGAVDWRWNDQARTYRPPKARFDPECQVVVEGFDHV